MNEMTDYEKYRGKCKDFVDKAILEDPSLRPVRVFIIVQFGVNNNIGGVKNQMVLYMTPQPNSFHLKVLVYM